MRKLLFIIALLSASVFAQQGSYTVIRTAGTLPSSCVVGGFIQKTGSSAGLYFCSASNTWTGPLPTSAGGTGTVTSIVAGTGLTGGTITTTGTIAVATAQRTRTCPVPVGSGSTAIVAGDYTNFPEGCLIDVASTLTQILVVGDAGASTLQLAVRSGNSNTNLTSSALTLATISGITGRVVVCANTGGTSITYQGQTVTCSTLASTTLAQWSDIVIASGTPDTTTKWMMAYATFTTN